MCKEKYKLISCENGNAMAIVMGGIAMVGLLGALTYSLLSGPVRGMQYITLKTTTENQMMTLSKVIAMDTVFEDTASDCDADNIIEPLAWRSSGAGDAPTNGGYLPNNLGTPTIDSWGSEFGYCVWDHGSATDAAGCGGPGLNRLDGADDPATGQADRQISIALISAGENRRFETTCKSYADAVSDGTSTIVSAGDDFAYSYTYNEASVASSSLWTLKTGDNTVSEIDKGLEITKPGGGVGDFIAVSTVGRILASGGVALGDETAVTTCDALNIGLLRYNTTLQTLQVCLLDGGSGTHIWSGISGGSGTTVWTDNTTHISHSSAHIVDSAETFLPPAVAADGDKFYWYANKGALRAGQFSGATNTESNIGQNSAAFGHNNIADYSGAFASGYLNSAYERAVAIGSRNTAQGNGPLAFGYQNTTTSQNSVAIGSNNESRASEAFAIGENAIVTGSNSMLFSLGNPSGTYDLTTPNTLAIMGGKLGIDNTDPKAKVHLGGNLMLRQDGDACDGTRNGTLQYTLPAEDFIICDGTNDITLVDVGAFTPFFVAYPNHIDNITITDPGPPAASAPFTITFKNVGTGAGSTVYPYLTNNQNFEVINDGCSGNNSPTNGVCSMTLRAIAPEAGPFEGYIIVSDGTRHAVAYMQGSTDNTICPYGTDFGGGKIADCRDDHYLISAPGGCSDSATPTCSGGDYITKVFHPAATTVFIGSASTTYGAPSTKALVDAAATFAAAKYCDDMDYGGYTDWYLPAYEEIKQLATQRNAIGGFGDATYSSSTQVSSSTFRTYNFASNSDAYPNNYNDLLVRCVRRDTSLPSNETTERAGYFVLTKDKHDGNFGSMQGAHDFCLSQLQTYDWKGKDRADGLGLIANGNVKAFLCPSWTSSDCGQLLSNSRFYFAAADEPDVGGASFKTTPASTAIHGIGPHKTETWAQQSHFGYISTTYWANRDGSSNWGNIGFFDWSLHNPSRPACGAWIRDSGSHRGYVGHITPYVTSNGRWGDPATGTREQYCSIPHRLICIVNP